MPLMGNRREHVDKEKEPTSKETKNIDNNEMQESQKNLLSKEIMLREMILGYKKICMKNQ